ncbi:MAG: peptidoglycan-binding protein [Ilumatobacteraceae bacterium]
MLNIRRVSTRRGRARRVVGNALVVASVGGLAFVAAPASVSAAPVVVQAPTLPQTIVGLREGSKGSDVSAVQSALLAAGVPVPGGADGVFGPATRSAVTAFQSRKGLTPSGEVDTATASALGLVAAAPAASSGASGGLSEGAKGDAVKELQSALMKSGVFVPGGADGVYGPATKTAVSNYQRWNGLPITGSVDATMSKKLGLGTGGTTSAPATPTTPAATNDSYVGMKNGSRGDNVKDLQRALIAAGISVHGGADGVFGPATQASLTSYQQANGLTANGVVDAATASKLGLGGTTATPTTPAPTPETTPSASSGYVGLTVGSQGDRVKDLQRALMNTGLTLLGGADGVFGNATKSTLMLFQKVNGIPQTGVVTSKGAGLLALGTSGTPQGIGGGSGYAVFGERGDRVKALQTSLMKAGISFTGGADGIFGASTAGAILEFQRREGLPVTGKVDDATASKLAVAVAPAPSVPTAAGVSIDVFPVQGQCWFGDTWAAPRGGGRTHEGTDVIAASGKLLYAAVSGTISKMYYDYPGALAGNGLRVAQDNGTYFTYLHLSAFADGIGVGTKVTAGQVIGYVGSTGNSGTPHLHFEVHPNGGAAVNPYSILKAVDACNITTPRS